LHKEGTLRLLAELNEERIRFGVTAGPSPRVGAAAVVVEAAGAAAERRPRPLSAVEGARGCESDSCDL